jgi:hypothetical protein
LDTTLINYSPLSFVTAVWLCMRLQEQQTCQRLTTKETN